jgi:hypothetical protein
LTTAPPFDCTPNDPFPPLALTLESVSSALAAFTIIPTAVD